MVIAGRSAAHFLKKYFFRPEEATTILFIGNWHTDL